MKFSGIEKIKIPKREERTNQFPRFLINFSNYTKNGFFVNLFLTNHKRFLEFIFSCPLPENGILGDLV